MTRPAPSHHRSPAPLTDSVAPVRWRRLGALALLAVVLVAVPVALIRLVGLPDPDDLSAGSLGRLDERAVVHLGGAVFVVLWGWFAVTVLSEIVAITRWRRRRRRGGAHAELATLEPSPSGVVRRLVRLALVSATVVGPAGLHHVAPSTVAAGAVDAGGGRVVSGSITALVDIPLGDATTFAFSNGADRSSAVAATTTRLTTIAPDQDIVADGRATPYSLALRLGDPALRERIIAANAGRPAPDGSTWSGGVFPAGMRVVVPQGLHDDLGTSTDWTVHVVEPGDSVHAIAAELCGPDRLRLRPTVDAILARNLGRTMVDGAVFRDPSLIRPGWELEVPVARRDGTGPAGSPGGSPVGASEAATWPAVADAADHEHVVEPGESYWSIAADSLAGAPVMGDRATPTDAEVLVAMEALRALNAPRLDRDDPNLIHPGDVLELPADLDDPGETVDDTGETVDIVEPARDAHPPRPAQPAGPTVVSTTEPAVNGELAPASAAPVAPLPPSSSPPPPNVNAGTRPETQPETQAGAVSETGRRPPLTTSLGAALLVCAGALGLIESRRRHQLRSAPHDAVVVTPTVEAATTERLLRSLDSIHRAARLDVMLRCVGHQLAGSGHHVVAVLTRDDGALDIVLDRPSMVEPAPPLQRVDPRRWSLPADVDTIDLSDGARLAGQPCPALVHLGTARDALTGAPAGDLLVDLEAVGMLSIDGPHDGVERVLLGIATSLAASPVGETLRLVTHGIDPAVHLGNLNAESASSVDEALDIAVGWLGSTVSVTGAGGRRTFELRARGTGGEAWEPVVVVSTGDGDLDRDELLDLTRGGGRGLAVVVGTALPGAGLTMRATGTGWVLERLGLTVVPVGLDVDQVHVVHDLLDAAERPLARRVPEIPRIRANHAADRPPTFNSPTGTGTAADVGLDDRVASEPAPGAGVTPAAERTDVSTGSPNDAPADHDSAVGRRDAGELTGPELESLLAPPAPPTPFEEPSWALMVRLLGPVEVIGTDGSPVGFERGKSLELVAWLSVHRRRPTRLGARTALWDLAIRDATFANVVSDARRAMARAVTPATGEEWIVRTTNDALPLHPLVLCDADVLQARVDAARRLPAAEAIEVLRPGVALVRGMPFENAGYLWPDAEGTTSAFVVLATGASTTLAQLALTEGDVETVFWATSQGLRVLPGHEELVALRMRAYALHGDLAGVRMEWELYERTIHSDPWSFGEPSPKLAAIRRELLSN